MKIITIAFYKLEEDNRLELTTFTEKLKELSTYLDGDTNRQVIDINKNKLETSIWFDSFNEEKYFNSKDLTYFLLAKDVNSLMKEDKKNNKLSHQDSFNDNIHLKIPAHFVYFPEDKILGVEQINDAPTKSVIERAFKAHLKESIKFNPINREDTVARLKIFLETIESVEFDMKDFYHLLKDIDEDEYLQFLEENNSTLKIKTYLETEKSKNYVFNLFSKLFDKKADTEILKKISNMSVKYKNNESKEEILSLINNFLVFKKEREFYLEDLEDSKDNITKRLKYSKSIYEQIIGCYNEYLSS